MSCDCFPLRWEQELAPGGADEFSVDFAPRLARVLARRTSYEAGVRLRSSKVAGFEWEVTEAGQTGDIEPRLPTVDGAWVRDGGAVLTCRPLSSASLEAQISAVEWSPPPGITKSGDSWDAAQKAVATLTAASNIEPGDYEILVTGTAGSKVIPQVCVLRVGGC